MPLYQIQIRRGTNAAWTTANPILAAGEFGLETDTKRLKVGTGSDVWSQLTYLDSGPPQVVASGGLADLTPAQQAQVTTGSVVAVPDGRRFAYSGSGPKTSESSYVVVGQIFPNWTDVANKPTSFPPPVATATALGGVRVGPNVSVTADGTISVAAAYVLPAATTTAAGGVQLADAAAVSAGTTGRVIDAAQLKTGLSSKVNASSLSTVATTGSYLDLLNLPTEYDGGNF